MGREEEIAYAHEHGIPIKSSPGSDVAGALLDRRQPLGPLLGGPLDRGPRPRARGRRLPARHAPRARARRGRGRWRSSSSGACPSRSAASAWSSWSCSNGSLRLGARHGVGIVDHIEDRIVGLKVRDIYEVPAAAILLARPPRARAARLHDPPEPVQGRARAPVGLPRLRRAVVGAAARRPRRLHGARQRARLGDVGIKLFKGHARVVTRSSPGAVYDASLASFAESGGLFSQTASPGFIELWSLQSRMAWRLHNE